MNTHLKFNHRANGKSPAKLGMFIPIFSLAFFVFSSSNILIQTERSNVHMAQDTLSQADLDWLTQKFNYEEVVTGIVKTSDIMTLPLPDEDGKIVNKKEETAVMRFPGGVIGYCPKSWFREHDFASLNGFIGTEQDVVIKQLDIDSGLALVSVVDADKQKAAAFQREIAFLQEEGTLQDRVYTGVIQGINRRRLTVHIRINGQDCFLKENEWGWNRRNDIFNEADRGMEVDVVVKRFDKQIDGTYLVEVSRRLTMPDPFEKLSGLRQEQQIMGKVSRIDKSHGIFVVVEGVELKGSKPRALPDPVLGEVVNVRVLSVDPENRVGRVIIVGYPRGKKKVKDLSEFLYGS
mgnify:CR=1 FL=1